MSKAVVWARERSIRKGKHGRLFVNAIGSRAGKPFITCCWCCGKERSGARGGQVRRAEATVAPLVGRLMRP